MLSRLQAGETARFEFETGVLGLGIWADGGAAWWTGRGSAEPRLVPIPSAGAYGCSRVLQALAARPIACMTYAELGKRLFITPKSAARFAAKLGDAFGQWGDQPPQVELVLRTGCRLVTYRPVQRVIPELASLGASVTVDLPAWRDRSAGRLVVDVVPWRAVWNGETVRFREVPTGALYVLHALAGEFGTSVSAAHLQELRGISEDAFRQYIVEVRRGLARHDIPLQVDTLTRRRIVLVATDNRPAVVTFDAAGNDTRL